MRPGGHSRLRAEMLARSESKNKHFNDLELLVLLKFCQKSLLLESGNHGVSEFLGASLAADVARRAFSLTVDLLEGTLDALRRLLFAEVIEHQSCTHQQGSGIGEPFASDVRSGTMYGFEHGAFVADIRAGHNAQPSDKARSEVAHYVAVKVRSKSMSNCRGSMTICMQALSTMSSLYSMAGNFAAITRTDFKNNPSESFMMLALCMA